MSATIRLKGATSGYVDLTAPDSGANTVLNLGRIVEEDSSGDISTGNITTTGYIRGPATFTIDPANHGDSTGTLRVLGNLTVDGTTTTINSQTVTTADKNIVLAQGAVDSAAADGAGITVDTAGASITYDHTNAEWDFNRDVNITGNLTTSSSNALYAGTSYGSVQIRDTSTTGQELHVRNNPGKNGFLTFTEDTIADRWLIGVEAGDASLLFKTGNTGSNTERMRIDGNGNVGIGITASDSAKLKIDGSGSHLRMSDTLGNGWEFRGATRLIIYDDGTEVIRVDENGRLGLGTNSPGVPLSIAGGTGDLLAVGNEGTNSEFIIGNWSSTSDADIDGLLSGSTFGTIMRAAPNGHVVLALRENDTADGFYVVSGGGNYQTDTTYDTVAMALTSAGNMTIAGTFTESSALRYKENVQDLNYNNIISQLKPKVYNKIGQTQKEVGLIAEEVAALDDTLVTYKDGEVEGIQYTRLVPHLIAHIQKLEERIARMENGESSGS